MILITGATGLVGANLMWHLLQQNDRIKAIRRISSDLNPLRTIFSFYTASPDDFLLRIDWIVADLLDEKSIVEALTGVKSIYHCAAVVSLANNSHILMDTNVRGTQILVEAALRCEVESFCFVSSIAACGKAFSNELVDENTPWTENENRSAYSLSKYFSEQEVWNGIHKGLNAVIVNPGVILGVSGTSTGSSQLFTQVRKGLMFYTNGGSGYVDVRDVVRAMTELMAQRKYGERYILVSENCSNKLILSMMADGFNKRRPFIGVGRDVLNAVGAISEMIGKLLNFTPLIDRSTARSASNSTYYTSRKIETELGFKFNPMNKCVSEVCRFLDSRTNLL